jgi:hypothetical protein
MKEEKLITRDDIDLENLPVYDNKRDAYIAFTNVALAKPRINWAVEGFADEGEKKAIAETWRIRLQNWMTESQIYYQNLSNRNLYLYFGTPKRMFDDMAAGKYGLLHQTFAELCYRICAGQRESLMTSGEMPASVGMFHQVNYDGMSNTQTLEVRSDAAPTPKTKEEIEDRWVKYLVEDTNEASKKA